MHCTHCNTEINGAGKFCPTCGQRCYPLTPTPPEIREGYSRTPTIENVSERIVEPRFQGPVAPLSSRGSRRVLSTVLVSVVVLLVLVGTAVGGYIGWKKYRASKPGATTGDIVIEKEPTQPAPAKPEAVPEPQQQAQEQARETAAAVPAPGKVPAPGVPGLEPPKVKPTPRASRQPRQAAPQQPEGRYHEPWRGQLDQSPPRQAQRPQQQPQAQKSALEHWLDRTLGPEVPVTPPAGAGDSRNGM